jgi:hypothetical protein
MTMTATAALQWSLLASLLLCLISEQAFGYPMIASLSEEETRVSTAVGFNDYGLLFIVSACTLR